MMTILSTRLPPRVTEPFLLAAELLVRQVYFRSAPAQEMRARAQATPSRRVLYLSELRNTLRGLGVREGDMLMVHSRLSKMDVVDDVSGAGQASHAPAAAAALLGLLRAVVGESGTLIIPTFPKYEGEPVYMSPTNDGQAVYRFDRLVTPSRSGLLTEVFRTSEGVIRSHFPMQTVSALGPLAEWLTDRNVEDGRGLAHGPHSPYGRLVARRGWVVSLGIPLIDYCTVVHAAEEARYGAWPITDFWRKRTFEVVMGGALNSTQVWERRPIYSRGYAEERLRRDVRRSGILKEVAIGQVECHLLRADQLFDLMMSKNAASTYPFFWAGASRLKL